ncbi:hypothetical protein K431DRAFT_221558 [Polychaeton citri CBS 116435]|uniref:RNA polymerase I-specific transcription initiation factor RRN6-like protein n=1 Tax=Polychaeton citri CBS 116435 TaxID=1314669 RepID=A0A9P4UNQ8_9PEZI|nr:hypothetical protein K431DRAFT_221558 [Polychaeton citri CBS 116435]
MAENAFPYGSFGRAVYDPDEKEWVFQRNTGESALLRQEWSGSTHPIPGTAEHSIAHDHQHTSAYVQNHVKGLLKARPEIEPASDLLPPLSRASHAAQRASLLQNPTCGSLISIGQVFVESSRRYVLAIAHASGSTGSSLRIVSLANERFHCNGRKDGRLTVPTPRGEEVTWVGNGAPIRQIVCSHLTEGSESLIAVRCATKVLIFRPVLLKSMSRQDATLLDANLLSELPLALDGQDVCVHVSFNPWYSRQLATIDQVGTWSIWELEGRKHVTVKKTVNSKSSRNETGQKAAADGWAWIAWLQNPNTILVCTRLEARLYDISAGPQYLQDINLEASLSFGWILDAVLLTSHLDHFALLTSTHLVLSRAAQSLSGHVTVENVCNVRHFLNADEPSLRIETSPLNEGTILLVIRSANSTLISYSFSGLGSRYVRVSDPATMAVHGADGIGCAMADCTGFVLQPVTVKERQQDTGVMPNAQLQKCIEKNLLLATILKHQMTLAQVMYSIGASSPEFQDLQLSTSDARSRARATRAPKEQFVITDDSLDAEESLEMRLEPVSLFSGRAFRLSQTRRTTFGNVNYGFAAYELVNKSFDESNQDADVIKSTQMILRSDDREQNLPWRTIRDHGSLNMATFDIETASQHVHDLQPADGGDQSHEEMTQPNETEAFTIRLLRWPNETHMHTLTSNLTETYGKIVSRWIAPLQDVIRERVRLSKDRLARRMAADIILASRVIGFTPIRTALSAQHTVGPSMQTWDLPLRGPDASHTHEVGLDQATSTHWSQAFTPPSLPTPRTTPSVITGSSSIPSNFSAPEVSRLTHYTSFSNGLPTSLPRSLRQVLSHWQPGTDPEDYDWLSSRNRLLQQAEVEDVDSQLTERDRRRLQKQAEKLLRKQRKENQSSQDQTFITTSSQHLPEIAVSVSQQPYSNNAMSSFNGGNIGSSQSLAGNGGFGAPASQVARGRFSGRGPPVKKKRKQGF